MHPAYSVIFFTAASGTGYGLIITLGLLTMAKWLPQAPELLFWATAFALFLVTFGLLSSLFHLGHPERSWRAFSQWRSSWLSREGVMSVLTYVPAAVLGFGWLFFGPDLVHWAGLAAAVMAAITVYCTAMIYVSLRPIRQWANQWVVPGYLSLALLAGALWLSVFAAIFGILSKNISFLVLVLLALAAIVKVFYWRSIDRSTARSTVESATGLGFIGKVRLLERPHTGSNYLMEEMGFRIARKHARKLRRWALLLLIVLPLIFTAASFFAAEPLSVLAVIMAALSCSAGVLVERWLFFAEATHTVTLYYGAEAA